MKKNILLLLCLFITFAVVAQKQQGLVRTIERPGQKSVGIKGATVKINGYPNALVSGKGGKFSFAIQGKKQGDRCLVTRVEKKGYTLIDKMPTFAYSISTPVEIVMVSNKQLQQDEQRIRGKAEKKAAAIYEKRIAELERQLNEKTISEEQYREQLQQVFDGHENFLKMIDEMARRYAMTDYKGISEINRQIQECIENAELERADTLINSKGDINQRKQEVIKLQDENDILAEHLKKRQEEAEFKKNDLAQDYYDKYYICAARYDNDSAAYYLEERASLDTTNVEWLNDAGLFITTYLAKYDLALELFQKELELAQTQFGESSEQAVSSYNNIGGIYNRKGDFDKAMQYYQKALEIQKRVLSPDHPNVATSYNNIGSVYAEKGEYNKALEYYQKALEIRKRVLSPDHPNVATSYNNIGSVYAEKGEYDKALEYYQNALNIKDVSSLNHPDVALYYNNIGSVYSHKADFDKAMQYHVKALDVWERFFGTSHPNIAISYSNIGSVYAGKGEYDKALEYHQKALDICERIFGQNHHDVAMSYYNIGSIYESKRDYNKALQYYQKSLAIRVCVLDSNHPDIADSYNNLGSLYFKQNDLVRAKECFEKSLSIYEGIHEADNVEIALLYNNIGTTYEAQNDYSSALDYYQKALGIFERVYGTDHVNVATSYNNLGTLFYRLGDYDKALEYYQKSLEIRERLLDSNSPELAESHNNIGHVYSNLGDYSTALPYYSKSWSISEKNFGADSNKTKLDRWDYYSCLYNKALQSGYVSDFLLEHCFIATVASGETPAKQQGMSGEYILLEHTGWSENSTLSFIEYVPSLRNKPKDLVVLKDGMITKHHFENKIGVNFEIKRITKEEREEINRLYQAWKKEQGN